MTIQTAPSASSSFSLPLALHSQVLDGPLSGKAKLRGAFPDWLRGRLIRTAPAAFAYENWKAEHWFDGLGMLYAFEIGTHRRISWKQRLLECEFNRSVLQGHAPMRAFGTPPQMSFFERLLNPIGASTDNTNVNILRFGENWIALTETEEQWTINPDTLQTQEKIAYQDALPKRLMMLAHPHYDFESRELLNIGVAYGRKNVLIVFRQQTGSSSRQEIGRVALRRVPYLHSFSVTPRKIILILHPYDLNPFTLFWSKKPISEHYEWRPEEGTRFVVMDRQTGATQEFTGDPFFVFHTVNAFEESDGNVHLDLMGYSDALIIRTQFKISEMEQRGLPPLTPRLERFILETQTGKVRRKSDFPEAAFEFPMIDYTRTNGRKHRFVWGSNLENLVKVDVGKGTVLASPSTGLIYGEPIFVKNPQGVAEDDGVLLSVGSGKVVQQSQLSIFDARTLDLLAEAEAPISIPLGYHGSFERAS